MLQPAPLIGRDPELGRVLEQLARIEHGGAAAVLVRGDAGIGKTMLARELVSRAEAAGHRTLAGRADEFDRGIPYALFRDLLAGLAAAGAAAAPVAAFRQGLDAVAGVAGAPADAHLSLVYARAVELFRALAADAGAVLFVEDIHLADADSLALVALLTRLAELPLLTVATMRPAGERGAVRDFERLIERMALDGRGTIVDLGPLDRDAVQALVAATLGAAPDRGLVDAALAGSGGNPWFARETVRALQDRDAIVLERGRATLVSESRLDGAAANTALLARVFGRGGEAVEVAKVVAAFGRFALRHLPLAATLTGRSTADVTAAFDRLVGEHLLVRGEAGYEFAHAIVRDALYEDIGPGERRALHAAIAQQLAKDRRSGAMLDIAELATHVAESADPGDEWAIEVLLEAARTVNVTAPLVAAGYFDRAIALLPPGSPRQASAQALQARALHIGSRPRAAAAVGRAALEGLAPGPQRRATVALVVNGLNIAGRLAEALEVVEEELTHGREEAPLLAQRLHLLFHLGRPDEAAAQLPAALAAFEAAPKPQLTAATHLLVWAGDSGDAALANDMLERFEAWSKSGPPARRLIAHEAIAFSDRRPGIVASLSKHLDAAAALRPAMGAASINGHHETGLVALHFLRGEWDEAIEVGRAAVFELEQRGVVMTAQVLRVVQCDILTDRGALDEAAALARAFVTPSEALASAAALCRARISRALGRRDDALELMRSERRRTAEKHTTWKRADLLLELADALLERGERDEACDVRDEIVGLATEPCRYEWPLAALHVRAVVDEDIGAARGYSARADREGIAFEQARAALVLGRLGVDPQEQLTYAYRRFDALDAGPWRRRASTLLREGGHRVPRPARRAAGVLTDTEAQLVRLVRDGLTNREIASAMHYSPKTVEVYLSRIYAKTRCSSRVQLVRALEDGAVELPAA